MVAGTIGAERSCRVRMTSVMSIPRRYTEVIPRSTLPSSHWMTTGHAFAGNLDGVATRRRRICGRQPRRHARQLAEVIMVQRLEPD